MPDEDSSPQGFSFEEILKSAREITNTSDITSQEIIQNLENEASAKKLQIELDGQKQFLDLQKNWANHIMLQIWAVLLFQLLFVIFVGFNIGEFTNNIKKLPYMYILVILQNLANIIALGFVVAKFLFPHLKKEA